jgi:two-component system, response regulator
MSAADLKQLFGSAVKSKRSALRISQEELADRSGLHRTYISDVERGVRNLSIESIEKLARALELSVSGLFVQAGNGGSRPSLEILLVEDSMEDVEMTLRAFRKARFTNVTHVVRDGAAALEFLGGTGRHADRKDAALPEVILLDLNLPKIGGLEVLRWIRANPRTRRIPVVVLTASTRHADDAACRQLGVETYIVKPVDFRSFSEVMPHLNLEWKLVKPLAEAST